MEGKNGDCVTITSGGKEADGGFYIQPEASGSSIVVDKTHLYGGQVGYIPPSDTFYMNAWEDNFYLGYAAGSNYSYKPPTLEEKIEEKLQHGYTEVVSKWYVHQGSGNINHLCSKEEVQGYPPDFHDALILNKDWHNYNVICSKCHQPAPSKVFFLSEAMK